MPLPMPLYMLLEAVLPRMARTAALTPVEREVLELRQRKAPGYAVETLQKFQHVLTGAEVPRQRLALTRGGLWGSLGCRRRCGLAALGCGSWLRRRLDFLRRARGGFHGLRIDDGQEQAIVGGARAVQAQQADLHQRVTDTQERAAIPEGH